MGVADVIVTGAAGFIGRHVVARLRAVGWPVTGIDRRPWSPAPGERMLIADLAEPDADVDRMLTGAGGVIHLAARPGVRDRAPDIARRRWCDTVLTTARVLETTPSSTVVVVASSSSVYGGAGDPAHPRACREDDSLRPRGAYARSKHAVEWLAGRRAAAGGAVGIARPFTVAGEGQRPDMAISTWIRALLRGDELTLFGDRARRRDITDVLDVAEGLVRMLDRRVTGVVNLGTGRTHRLDETVATVARACGVGARVRVVSAPADEVAATRADVTTCRQLLGFVPTTDLEALVRRQLRAVVPADGAPPHAAAVDASDARVEGLDPRGHPGRRARVPRDPSVD